MKSLLTLNRMTVRVIGTGQWTPLKIRPVPLQPIEYARKVSQWTGGTGQHTYILCARAYALPPLQNIKNHNLEFIKKGLSPLSYARQAYSQAGFDRTGYPVPVGCPSCPGGK